MNAESVQGWLLAVGVPAEVVSIGAEADNTWCLVRDDEGFEVFWREQGNRYDWARFTSEDVACHYLFGRLVWAQVVRGAVGLLPQPDRTGEPEPAEQADRTQPVPAATAAGTPEAGTPADSATPATSGESSASGA
nr:hypothetical protein GCM10017745_14700 [Saccharothrix mutabilis subsp. capreolus]